MEKFEKLSWRMRQRIVTTDRAMMGDFIQQAWKAHQSPLSVKTKKQTST
jgi:hypothetical protein